MINQVQTSAIYYLLFITKNCFPKMSLNNTTFKTEPSLIYSIFASGIKKTINLFQRATGLPSRLPQKFRLMSVVAATCDIICEVSPPTMSDNNIRSKKICTQKTKTQKSITLNAGS